MTCSYVHHPLRLLILILFATTPVAAQNNIVGLDILGRALLYSANYERHFNRLGLGLGVAAWDFDNETAVVVPMYVSYRPVGVTNSLYLAGGATVGSGRRTLFDKPVTVGTAAVGYEHRSSSGLVIRPTASLIFDREGFGWWPGLLVGFRF